ncbi:MAG: response regulator [Nitrospirae bacterium]|nr:response regulator [Nitrospirota bacterium]
MSTVQRWIDSGDIPAHRTLGGHRRIQMRDLVEMAHAKGLPLLGEIPVSSRTVLVIDDEPDVLETLAVRIRGMRPDLKVLAADSGFKAGVLVRSTAPALILLDIRMPGMDGIEVCRMLRADPATASSRVVGLTAYRERRDVEALKSAGAMDVFFKPFEPEALGELLDRVLPRHAIEAAAGGTGDLSESKEGFGGRSKGGPNV